MLSRQFFRINCNLYFHLLYKQATNTLEDIVPFNHTVISCTLQFVSYGPWSFISEYLNILIRLSFLYIRLLVLIKRWTLRVKTYLLYVIRIKDTHTMFLPHGSPLIFIIFPYFFKEFCGMNRPEFG